MKSRHSLRLRIHLVKIRTLFFWDPKGARGVQCRSISVEQTRSFWVSGALLHADRAQELKSKALVPGSMVEGQKGFMEPGLRHKTEVAVQQNTGLSRKLLQAWLPKSP